MVEIILNNVKHIYGIIGNMGKTKINELCSFPLGLIDKTLHTYFCFCDMDAICLNEGGHVLQKIHMTPWNYYLCHKYTTDVIEGPVGSFDFIEEGDLIHF